MIEKNGGYLTKRLSGLEDIFQDNLGLEYDECENIPTVISNIIDLDPPDEKLEEIIPRLESQLKGKLYLLGKASLHLRLDQPPYSAIPPAGRRTEKNSIRSARISLENNDEVMNAMYTLAGEIRILMLTASERGIKSDEETVPAVSFGFSPADHDERKLHEPVNTFYGHADDIGCDFFVSDQMYFDSSLKPFPCATQKEYSEKELQRMRDVRKHFDHFLALDLWETRTYFCSLLAANELLTELQNYLDAGVKFYEIPIVD